MGASNSNLPRAVSLAAVMAGCAMLGACGGSEREQQLNTAEEVYRAHANNLEQAADSATGARQQALERAAEIQERRAEALDERPGAIPAEPVIVEKKGSPGVEGATWQFGNEAGEARPPAPPAQRDQ